MSIDIKNSRELEREIKVAHMKLIIEPHLIDVYNTFKPTIKRLSEIFGISQYKVRKIIKQNERKD